MKKKIAIILTTVIILFYTNAALAYPALDLLPGLTENNTYENQSTPDNSPDSVTSEKVDRLQMPVIDDSLLDGQKTKDANLLKYLDEIIKTEVKETEQFLLEITSPKLGMEDQNVYKKTYVFCGEAQKPGLRVVMAVYNPQKEVYTKIKTADDGVIGASNLFASEVSLKEGENRIKVIVYEESQVEDLDLDNNVQVNYYTITYTKESIKDQIVNGVRKLVDVFNQVEQKLNVNKD